VAVVILHVQKYGKKSNGGKKECKVKTEEKIQQAPKSC
jgi:hypothetical protein